MTARKLALLVLLPVSCSAPDRTITAGADTEPGWQVRLAAAVPLGTPLDSALVTMEANGFSCRQGADSVTYVWCNKTSPQRNIVQRRWQAVINFDNGRVLEVRAMTGLVGP